MDKELAQFLNETFSLQLTENKHDQLQTILSSRINYLINNDFNLLVNLLYRIDVNETKLKKILKEKNTLDAAEIIATLFIERQLQKIKSRRESGRENDFSEEEKW